MSNHYSFVGGDIGAWRVTAMQSVCGPALPPVTYIDVLNELVSEWPSGTSWVLRGVVSNVRYSLRSEIDALRARQPQLNRPSAHYAALIPIKKSDAWWGLAQDERRVLFEEVSRHTTLGMDYLPAIARRLHHSRDLDEPFDFVTWFEYAPKDAAAFDELLAKLRASREWEYVEREVDIRLERVG